MYNGDCDLLIYNYIIRRHISNLTSEIRFPKFCLSFQSAKNVSLEMYCGGVELGVLC